MKVLLVAPQPFYAERGTPIAVRLLAEEVASLGHEVDLLTYWEGEDISIPGVRHLRCRRMPGVSDIPIGFSGKKLIADLSLFASFLRIASSGKYDIVHAVEESVYLALANRWLHGAAVVYDMDSDMADRMTEKFQPLARLFRWAQNWAVRRSDWIIAVCEDLAAPARKLTSPDSIFVLNDIAPQEATEDAAEDDLRVLAGEHNLLALYVGNLEYYQGAGLLVDAAERLPNNCPVKIVIIGGSDPDIAEMQLDIDQRNLANRIHLAGRRPLTQLMAYLKQADILLSPRASGTNAPLKIYSYMAAEKPIVATAISSHTQVLDERTAFLAQPDGASIAKALETLAKDTGQRETLGRNAKLLSDAHFTLDSFRNSLGEAYTLMAKARDR